MSKIKIKNFGPIKDGYQENDGWMDIEKVTVFIGDQATGKSCVAKLISTMSWLEKALYRGDISNKDIRGNSFVDVNCAYHRINNYFREGTEIYYTGDLYSFVYKNGLLTRNENQNAKKNIVPKIMYVPAERNFLSVVEDVNDKEGLPQSLGTFAIEYSRSNRELNGILDLPISNLKFEYNKLNGVSEIVGVDYRINLLEASSGLQSSVPLFIVSRNLALGIEKKRDPSIMPYSVNQFSRMQAEFKELLTQEDLTEEQRQEKKELIESKYDNGSFLNIVEEIEQNLFPTSQWQMLQSLLAFNNLNDHNKLIMTTHSPYIINYISIAIQGEFLLDKINKVNRVVLKEKLEKVVPLKSVVSAKNVIVYQLERNGTIAKLANPEGIPSDKNSLNQSLAHGNQMFDSLLELEEEI